MTAKRFSVKILLAGFLALAGLGIAVIVYLKINAAPPEADLNSSVLTHVSQFFPEARYIEKAVNDLQNTEKLPLDGVSGGVVTHHIPTAVPLIAEFYARLKRTKNVETFIILAPDHFNKGNADLSISEAEFVTPFGTVKPDLELIKKIEEAGYAVHDERPFDDHSIQSQLPFISLLFPGAKIVPIVFRSNSTNVFGAKLGEFIASMAGLNIFVVASVDFSHYLPEMQANPLDKQSAALLSLSDIKLTGEAETDSPQALTTLIAYVNNSGAKDSYVLGVFNSAQFNRKAGSTTGYVVGYFGNKYKSGSMFFVGDIMLSRSVGDLMERKNDYNFPFEKTADFLKSADLTFGNLEGPISGRGVRVGSKYSFRADPKVIQGLQHAGFDVVDIANNHIWDYGREAFLDTLKYLKEAGISYIGGGYDFSEAHAGIVKNVNGVRVAFLGYTGLLPQSVSAGEKSAGASYLDMDQIVKDVKEIEKKSDIVIVSFHWGEEYQAKHNQRQEQIAKAAVDAGADLIVGHHPHVVQEVEQYKNGWIAYSLGNFVFDQLFSKETMQGLALFVELENSKISNLEKIPVDINNYFQPTIDK